MSLLLNKAVFLDRDGVLNQSVIREGKPYPPSSVNELKIIEGVTEALSRLKQAGYLLIGATNQPDVARGTTKREVVEAINHQLMEALPLEKIFCCFHDDVDHCNCRKPKAGLILAGAQQYQIDLDNSFMIGDRWKDIKAGQEAGCKTVWIHYGYDEKAPDVPPDFVTNSLSGAADWILSLTVNEEKDCENS